MTKPSLLLLTLVLPLILAYPGRHFFLRGEMDTRELADWIARHTNSGDVIVSDYAEINFHAGRESIYYQGVISGNWATTGLVTTELLVDEMERDQAEMVIHHIEGGDPSPHHLVSLPDYDLFRTYLQDSYDHVLTWDRAGQLTEIWQRRH